MEQMKSNNIKPDAGLLVAILSAYAMNGEADKMFAYFQEMVKDHGIIPDAQIFNMLIQGFTTGEYLKCYVELC